jgi:hypothetical protein
VGAAPSGLRRPPALPAGAGGRHNRLIGLVLTTVTAGRPHHRRRDRDRRDRRAHSHRERWDQAETGHVDAVIGVTAVTDLAAVPLSAPHRDADAVAGPPTP